MTNHEFGKMIHGECNVARVRAAILNALADSGETCDAVQGFVSVSRDRSFKPGAEKAFLKRFDYLLSCQQIKGLLK